MGVVFEQAVGLGGAKEQNLNSMNEHDSSLHQIQRLATFHT